MTIIKWNWFNKTTNSKTNYYVIRDKHDIVTYTEDVTKATFWGNKNNAENWIKKQDSFWASFCEIENNHGLIKYSRNRSQRLWKPLKDKYGSNCIYCGIKLYCGNFTIEHLIPKSKGGSDYIENLRPCCGFCNSTHKNPLEQQKQKNPNKILKTKLKFLEKEEKRQASKWKAFCIPHA